MNDDKQRDRQEPPQDRYVFLPRYRWMRAALHALFAAVVLAGIFSAYITAYGNNYAGGWQELPSLFLACVLIFAVFTLPIFMLVAWMNRVIRLNQQDPLRAPTGASTSMLTRSPVKWRGPV